MEKVVRTVIPKKYVDDRTIYHLQPSGKFIIGGPQVSISPLAGLYKKLLRVCEGQNVGTIPDRIYYSLPQF